MRTANAEPTSLGVMPPQNLEAERAVLGAMLLNRQAVLIGIEQLRSRAVVRGATSFRRYFVVFLGLALVQILSGCIMWMGASINRRTAN